MILETCGFLLSLLAFSGEPLLSFDGLSLLLFRVRVNYFLGGGVKTVIGPVIIPLSDNYEFHV